MEKTLRWVYYDIILFGLKKKNETNVYITYLFNLCFNHSPSKENS